MKNRYKLSYSLSVLEIAKAHKVIKEYSKNEVIKPYGVFSWFRKLCLIGFGFACFFALLIIFDLTVKIDEGSDILIRMKNMGYIVFILLGASFLILISVDELEKFVMKKNDNKERDDQNRLNNLKLNRFYIENAHKDGSSKIFWTFIKKTSRKNEFIFIQSHNNEYIVIPNRVLPSEEEIQQLYTFIQSQIEYHAQRKK
ncbi:hypothetical protein Xmau_04103 [Xenorhabdus mauleonii]|uniref:YcxB-like protein n=1 Tax=Xenorhabdus mauleonii TaxID=351675 RepID=A0A1I3W8Q3_9GAMM|nr:YcxB family protein [Xenorhabdus mauleonii]PHM36740.1 hypothetical protein Xmau_04103 [Xenorhabdus mauleonii]SFK03968.1 YcxB-like protein [Xenorhabdus mauleonii]